MIVPPVYFLDIMIIMIYIIAIPILRLMLRGMGMKGMNISRVKSFPMGWMNISQKRGKSRNLKPKDNHTTNQTPLMNINSAMLYVIDRIQNLTFRNAMNWMVEHNFTRCGSGCESVVYTRDGFDYVIKIQYSAFTLSGVKVDNPSPKHFMETEVVYCEDFNIIIQKKVTPLDDLMHIPWTAFEKFKDFILRKFPNVTDVHCGNCGLLNGRMVVIDWNYDPNRD